MTRFIIVAFAFLFSSSHTFAVTPEGLTGTHTGALWAPTFQPEKLFASAVAKRAALKHAVIQRIQQSHRPTDGEVILEEQS